MEYIDDTEDRAIDDAADAAYGPDYESIMGVLHGTLFIGPYLANIVDADVSTWHVQEHWQAIWDRCPENQGWVDKDGFLQIGAKA